MTVHRRVLGFALLTLFFLLISTNLAAAQSDMHAGPRAISALSNSFNNGNVTTLRIPDVGDNIDISSFTVEANEPGASCTNAPLGFTAWFAVHHPGGDLEINTAYNTGTSFDSVVQLFDGANTLLSGLVELGCDDNTGEGSSNNDARLTMPNLASKRYYVRISCIALCGGTNDLALAITYSSTESAPANDSINSAKQLKIGKAMVTKNIEHTSVAASEHTILSTCVMNNTVWYKFKVPFTGYYAFSTFGSKVKAGIGGPNDTKIAVYTSTAGPVFTALTQVACNDDFGNLGPSATGPIELLAGQDVFVRIGSFTSSNLLNGSSYRLKTTVVSLGEVLENGTFSSGLLAPWTMKFTDTLNGVTNAYFSSGGYSARMVGAPGTTNKLSQKWSTAGIKLPKDGHVVGRVVYSTNGTTSSKAKVVLTLKYKSGPSAKATVKLPTQTGGWSTVYLDLPVKKANLSQITLTVINKSPGGLVFVDTGSLRVFGAANRGADMPAGVLPPPEAPAAALPLRGSN